MKKILIIYPHWPPSNLAGVHRPRLISNFISDFGWEPIVLTVKSEFYEEAPDEEILKTVKPGTDVRYVDAKKVSKKFRLFGDIGLRAYKQLKTEAKKIIEEEGIDFVWIPIPSFYVALIGRSLNTSTGVKYGIDYIDPWVDGFTNHQKIFSRSWISNLLSKILEPKAVKEASLISGVSFKYYEPVLKRNFSNKKIAHVAMPYGFDPNDHQIQLNVKLPWENMPGCKAYLYAGAFLPKSVFFIHTLFKAIQELRSENKLDSNAHFFFIGTGTYNFTSIKEIADQYGLSSIVHEDRSRHKFLHILNYLSKCAGVLVIGSTEKHYTASKTFQSILSGRPLFSMLHELSSAVKILNVSNADSYLVRFNESKSEPNFLKETKETLLNFLNEKNKWKPSFTALNKYSARESAKALAEKLDEVTK